MAEFADILHMDNPRGSGMDEPFQAGLSPKVDYEDVFGGPPRFTALMSVPHMPTALFDKTTARQLSFRTSALPVFDLPVFGDNAHSSTVYEARDNSHVYDDIFDEEGPMPDAFSAFKLRSIASSRASSRLMSPVHAAAAFTSQPGGDETLIPASSTAFLKTRPAFGKFSKRGPLPSASSFDESSGKLGDVPFGSLRNDTSTLSLPSSPPQSGLQSMSGSSGSVSIGAFTTSPEVDDVFGGFPKRMFPQPFSAVPHDSSAITSTPETLGTRVFEKAGVKTINMEGRSSSAAYTSEASDIRNCNFSRSPSVNSCRDQHDKENIDDEVHPSLHSSFKIPTPIPQPAQNAELRFKSWKDLVSDLPAASHSSTSRSIIDLVSHATRPSMVASTGDVKKDKDAQSLTKKQFDKNLPAQQNTEKLSQTTAVAQEGHVKSAEYTVDLEERELQALLANAWKLNKQMERENYNAKFPEAAPKVEVKDLEPHWEEQRAGQPKSSHILQCDTVAMEKRHDNVNWKEWRKYGHRHKKELSGDVGLDEILSTKDLNLKKPVSLPDICRSLGETSVLVGAAKEEVLTDHVLASFKVSLDTLTGLDSPKEYRKGVSSKCARSEYLVKEKGLERFHDFERAASVHGSMSESSQDSVHNNRHIRLFFCEPVEDAECLIDLAASLGGFQEVEGETSKHRKFIWEEHIQAREHVGKSLEELQHIDVDLQHQQEEKHQFSEISEGKIKRWAAGKEGNLRALLSNLQHVLWSECGWKPIPLTDLIEVPDVKKAYRKATLVVHPDKVQQRGASIQQKYIAERVFDILQEAWKTFNLQESF